METYLNPAHASRYRPGWIGQVITLIMVVASLNPSPVGAQAEVSAGVIVIPQSSIGGTQVGVLTSAAFASRVLRIPLLFEVSVARTDFNSLGQDYHNNHYLFMLGAEWFLTRGTNRLGLRLGLGAYGEYNHEETGASTRGYGNWLEAVVPGLVLARDLEGGRQLIIGLTDFVLGPVFAVLDSSEYDIDHRVRLAVGMRF